MGIRLGTPWLTQRGFGPAEMDEVARLIHKTVTNIRPFSYIGLAGELPRGKIDLDLFEEIKHEVADLAAQGRRRDGGQGQRVSPLLQAAQHRTRLLSGPATGRRPRSGGRVGGRPRRVLPSLT